MDIYEQSNIGKAKYVVSYYSGKKHADGSDFYDIKIFSNKRAKDAFVKALKRKDTSEHLHDASDRQ